MIFSSTKPTTTERTSCTFEILAEFAAFVQRECRPMTAASSPLHVSVHFRAFTWARLLHGCHVPPCMISSLVFVPIIRRAWFAQHHCHPTHSSNLFPPPPVRNTARTAIERNLYLNINRRTGDEVQPPVVPPAGVRELLPK